MVMTVEKFWSFEMEKPEHRRADAWLDVALVGDPTPYIAKVLYVEQKADGRYSVRLGGIDGDAKLFARADGNEKLYGKSEGVPVTKKWLRSNIG